MQIFNLKFSIANMAAGFLLAAAVAAAGFSYAAILNNAIDGNYLWQSLETGALGGLPQASLAIGGMENKPQFAGYRFAPRDDAYATELCGYFKGVHSVNLYDQSFKMLASSQITAYEQWNCAAIKPVALAKGQKYYAIAEMDRGPVYYRFAPAAAASSGVLAGQAILPLKNADAVIESGITQTADRPFGAAVESNTGRVFGLVDVKITPRGKAQALVEKAGASLAGAIGGGQDLNEPVLGGDGPRVCASGRCIVCGDNDCRIENDAPTAGQTEDTFIQICRNGFCYSCTNANCARTDAAGFVKTGYSFKKCKNNKCVNCLNSRCNVTGGQAPHYLYQWSAGSGGMDGGSFFMDTGTSGSSGSSGAWESYYGGSYSGDAFGGGGGGSFDPAVAAKAMINPKFTGNDQVIIDALAAWGDAHPTEAANGTVPSFSQLAKFINDSYAAQAGNTGKTLIDINSVSSAQKEEFQTQITSAAAELASQTNSKGGVAIAPKTQTAADKSKELIDQITSGFSKKDPVTGKYAEGNKATSAFTRPSDLTTGWGQKMNSGNAKNGEGNPLYSLTALKDEQGNEIKEVGAGRVYIVDSYSTADNGKTFNKTQVPVFIDTQDQANAYNALIAEHGGLPTAVREAQTAYGLLNSNTANTFTNYGTASGGASAPTVPASLPDGAIIVNPAPVGGAQTPTGNQTAASQVVSDWMPANIAAGSITVLPSRTITEEDVFSTRSPVLNARAAAANPAITASRANEVYSGSVKYGPGTNEAAKTAQDTIDGITSGFKYQDENETPKNPENSVFERRTDLIFGQKANPPVVGYVEVDAKKLNGGKDIAPGDTIQLPIMVDGVGQTGTFAWSPETDIGVSGAPNYSTQANTINNHQGKLLVAVFENVKASDKTAVTEIFSAGGAQAGSVGLPLVAVALPAGAAVIDPVSGKVLAQSPTAVNAEAVSINSDENDPQNLSPANFYDADPANPLEEDRLKQLEELNNPGAMIDRNIRENLFGASAALAAGIVLPESGDAANAAPPTVADAKASVLGPAVKISAMIKGAAAVIEAEARVRGKDGRFAAVLILDNGGKGDNWSYEWKNAGIAAGEYQVDIFAKDAADNFIVQNNAAAFNPGKAAAVECRDLQTGGAPDKKIDVIFVPCGYGKDLSAFEADARRQMEAFSKIVPIAQNIEKFNFRAAIIAGLDCAADLQDNMDKDANDFAAAVRGCAPDMVLVLKKQIAAGAKGVSLTGAGIGFAAANAPTAAIHEFGHAFFYLNDEYSYGCTYADMSNSANCDDSPKCEKWSGLIGAGCYAGCTCEGNYRSANDSVMLDPEKATQFSPAAMVQVLKILSLFE